jgi:hypothetical protein
LAGFESAPLAVIVSAPPVDHLQSKLETDELFLLARASARWLLVNGYLISSENGTALDALAWHDHSRSYQKQVLYDAIITDKGLQAIGKVISFKIEQGETILEGLTAETVRETIKSLVVDGVKAAPSVLLNSAFLAAFLS